jgi:hypothetical protein
MITCKAGDWGRKGQKGSKGPKGAWFTEDRGCLINNMACQYFIDTLDGVFEK